jgi:hypothetical protein
MVMVQWFTSVPSPESMPTPADGIEIIATYISHYGMDFTESRKSFAYNRTFSACEK